MISVRSEEPGCLTIDFSHEPSFNLPVDGIDLKAGLFVRRSTPTSLVVEDNGRPGPVVDYIKSTLESEGYDVVVESKIVSAMEHAAGEEKLAERVRATTNGEPRFQETPLLTKLPITRSMLPHHLKGMNHALAACNAANFSVPGSGKTSTTLCTYAVLVEDATADVMLVIGPASSFQPWEDEFKDTFGREPNVIRLVGSATHRADLLKESDGVDLVLCTYQMAYRERENLHAFFTRKKVLFVLDESHYIKNIHLGPWTQTVLELAPRAVRRLILTGTPMPHSLRDLWSQFTFLWPTEAVLKDRASYEQRAQSPEQSLDDIRKEIRPFFHRTKRSELGLPKSEIQLIQIPNEKVPKSQRLILRLLELKVLNEARSIGLGGSDFATLKNWRRARTIRLMQAASNPSLLSTVSSEFGIPDYPFADQPPRLGPLVAKYKDIPAKAAATVEIAARLISEGRKVVIWAHFIKNLELLENLLREFNPLVIHGGVPAYNEEDDPDFANRESHIRDFKERADRPLLLANPGACSESISLHKVCQDAIYFERTFNCGQYLQSMDRINRVGMPPGTHARYYIPLMPCGIERVVHKRLEERQHALHKLLEDDLPLPSGVDEDVFFDPGDNLEVLFSEVLAEIEKDAINHGRAD